MPAPNRESTFRHECFDVYDDIVLDGELIELGMPAFKRFLKAEDVADLRHYLITLRNEVAKGKP